jgi:hypothetical protein
VVVEPRDAATIEKSGLHKGRYNHERVIGYLEERGRGLDAGAARQQRRRLAAIGDWQTLGLGHDRASSCWPRIVAGK